MTRRLLLASWGFWCLAAAAWAWPLGSRAYASGTADGGILAAVIWQICVVDAAFGLGCILAACRWRRAS